MRKIFLSTLIGFAMAAMFPNGLAKAEVKPGNWQISEGLLMAQRGGGNTGIEVREGGTGKALLIDENIPLGIPANAPPAAAPVAELPPPAIVNIDPKDRCEEPIVKKGREAIETCRQAPDFRVCVEGLDKESQDGYALLCTKRDKAPEAVLSSRGGDAVEALDRPILVQQQPRVLLPPCECLESLKERAPECSFASCPPEIPAPPPPVAEVPVVDKVQAPQANSLEISGGGCFSSLVPVGYLYDVGWMLLWILPPLAAVLRRRNKR